MPDQQELIQNAEDAGAKEVKFLYDHHSYGTEHLHHPGLAKFQGPALYAYNDAEFTEADWKGIGMLCESIKEKDLTKVGRFGLGFKSVFHMTDLPSVISADSLGIIDPHEIYFSDWDYKSSGKRWNLKRDKEIIQTISDQFAPYKGILDKCFQQGIYKGTLFRLPLRQKPSKLTETIYTENKIKGIFECFEKDAHLILLFLMNLERIEVYERDANSLEPRKLFHVGISNSCLADVRKARKEFSAKVEENISALSDGCFNEVKKTYSLTIETVNYHGSETHDRRLEHTAHSFVVTLFFSGSDVSPEIKALIRDDSLSYLPLVGIALPLEQQVNRECDYREEDVDMNDYHDKKYAHNGEDEHDVMESSGNDHEDKKDSVACVDLHEPKGHLFCFLPLPLENKSLTGLPVHVNGFFALSQNRRHLKWPSADQDKAIQPLTDKSLLWNKGLLNEVLPKAYAELVLQVTSRLPRENAYAAWPDVHQIDVKWRDVLQPLFRILLKSKVLYGDANSGVRYKVNEVLLDDLGRNEQSRKIVIDVLNRAGRKVVTVPVNVKTALQQHYPTIEYVTPRTLRKCLKADPSCYVHLNHKDKTLLLKYVLSDSDHYKDLEGLELLPLSDKTFTTFRRGSDPIYIDSSEHPKSLLPRLQKMFVDTEIDTDLIEQLKNAATEGHTQIYYFGKEAVKRHLRQTLPSDWLSSEEHVTWYPGISGQPTTGWLKELWLYFGSHFHETASDLDAFLGLPLVPVSSLNKEEVQLARIQRNSSLIVDSYNGENIDEAVCQVLMALGLPVLFDLPDYVKHYPRLVPAIANPASPRGILGAIGAKSQHQNKFLQRIRELPADKIRSLRTFLSSISVVTSSEVNLLCKLPVFETFVGYGRKNSRFVSINEVKVGAPVDDLPRVSVLADLLDLRDHSSRVLAHILNSVPMSRIDFIKTLLDSALAGKYSESDVGILVKYTLKRFGIFHGEDFQYIKERLQCLPFVLSSDYSRKKPSELFNPDDDLLRQIFIGEDVFPLESYYSQPEVNAHLKKLGLKQERDIASSDVLNSAKKVTGIQNHSLEKAMQKSKGILTYLNKHLHVLNKRNASDELSLHFQLSPIPWVPVVTRKPPTYPTSLPLKESDSGCFSRIKDVKSNSFINLVGSVKNLVDVQAIACSQLSDYFNWEKKPDVSEVIMHLGNVISNYHVNEKSFFITIAKEIYKYMAKEDSSVIIKELQEKGISNWVWNGDGFSSPSEMSIKPPSINLSPYFSSLPPETGCFSNFFKEYGMKVTFDEEDLVKCLQKIKENHQKRKQNRGSCERDLTLVITILNKLKPQNGEPFSKGLREKLFIPIDVEDNARLELAPVMECTYCDPEWERQGYGVSDLYDKDEATIKLIHRNIPHSTAELLGVPTLLSRFLSAEELQMGESFGQSESLLDRLRGLLEGYTDGLSVPKELIQNADDAGATEVRFLYDERTNEDCMTCLIDDGMKECQGPALWAYNNAVFSDEDFQNIVKLNAATKKDDSAKIGRFGLGFNSVYNLTDVPSFVSRTSIVILDPHTTYLGKAIRDKSKPGIKMRMEEKKLRRLANQFKPYNGIFGCDLRPEGQPKSYNGTLFRFPLRTASQARKSDIKKLHYDDKQVRDLLRILFDGAESLLLFTQNVLRVTVYHLRNESTESPEPIELFRISKSCSKVIHRLESELSISKPVQELTTEDKDFVNQSSILKASSSMMKDRLNGNFSSPPRVLMKTSMILKCQCTLTDNGTLYFGIYPGRSQASWLVTSCMVSGKALDMSLRNRGLLPTAGVAAKLTEVDTGKYTAVPITMSRQSDIHYQSTSSHNGNVFCFLPLPIHSGLPVHINGCFAVSDNRRYLRKRTEEDKTHQSAEWNDILLKEVVCQTYISLLEDVKKLSSSSGYQFHLLWPRYCDVQAHCQGMVAQFYRSLFFGVSSLEGYSRIPELFSDGKKWSSIQNVVFLEPAFSSDERVGEVAVAVMKTILERTNKIVINLPEEIFQSFERYELQSEAQNRCYNKERFFREVFFPAISSVDASSRDKLVLYALDDTSEELRKLIRNYRCIPSSPSGHQLKYPAELFHPNGKAAGLFSSEDERLPYGKEFTCEERLVKLKRLGMRDDYLEWGEVIERAESIKRLAPYHRGLERTKLILAFIDRKLLDKRQVDKVVQTRLHQIQFFPVMKKPEGFPFKWKGDEYTPNTFLSAAELYPRELKYLAGSSIPILDDSKNGCGPIYSSVKRFLSMNKNASLDQVKVQLKIMIDAKEAFHNGQNFEELKKAFGNVYDHLQSSIEQNSQEVVEFLKPLRFILIEKQLLSCRQVVFSSQVNYPPYLSELPLEYKHRLGKLFKAIGVRECFEMHDYIQILQHVKHKYGENPIGEELLQVTNLLDSLAEEMLKKGVSATDAVGQHGSIFVPDSKEIMKASKDVCVKDCYWMPDEPGVNYINEKVLPQLGITLGANTRRQETLRKHAFGIPFGQKEKLTNRLNRILTGYPCDESILKELLQNADDAKATKICFINDPRQHPCERVFEECWKPLQGPALCVYNDAPFTKSDIEGIQNLGEGSKGDDPIKTGQFGVGFNAVYHLTDAPTFISQGDEIGEAMCVFDPNLKFAPDADPSSPGVMYKDLAHLREMFTDVFPCYLSEHFPLNNGTMFRFPLRNDDMARTSKISNKAMTTETLNELLKEFKKELLQVLLFVNNVREISLCEIDDETGEMAELYKVSSCLSPEDQKNRTDFAVHVNEIGKRLKRREISVADISVTKVSYILYLEDSKGFKQNWLVTQQIGFENTELIPDNIDEAFKRGDLGLLPRGGVASLISSSEKHQNLQGKAFSFLPLPCNTGLPVHINGHFALNQDRRSLWRDDKGDYRSNWNDTLLRQVIAPCYVTLLDEVRQYICLPRNLDGKTYISGSRHNGECAVLNYFKFFPSFSVQDENWKTLTREVYQFMNTRKFHLLPVLREENDEGYRNQILVFIEWLPPTGHGRGKAYFGSLLDTLPADFDRLDEKMKNKAVERKNMLRDTLLALGINLLFAPMEISNHFIEANVDVSFISPRDVIDYLLTYDTSDQLCAIGTLPLPLQQTPFKSISNVIGVFEYCKQDSKFLERLEGLPLLVTHDEVLRVFSQSNKVFVSGFFNLLPACCSMFVHGKLFKCETKLVQSPVLTTFDIASFARLLPEEINENYYKATNNRCITWHPDSKENQIPNKEWIHQVWKFFSSFIERIIKTIGAQKTRKSQSHSSMSQNQQKDIEESPRSHNKIAGKGLTQEALSPVMDCCLLPAVESGTKHVLFPVSMADSVIHLDHPGYHDLKDALNKLLLPTLNCRVIDGEGDATYSVTARRIVGDLDDPESVLTVLLRKVESDYTPFKSLSYDDCISVLRYFDSSFRMLQPLVSDEKLRKLPLYVTVDDGIVNISGKQAFVLSSRIPKEDMHIWEETSGIVFLKKNDSFDQLYNFLKCATKDEVDVYCDVIFEMFGDMNEDARLQHLTFVYQLEKELDDGFCMDRVEKTGNRKKKLEKLRKALCKLKFLKAKDGSLQTASSFHDPSNQVFRVLFENKQEMFPPEPFRNTKWLPFLCGIGLVHKVSDEEFLKFAKQVELEAKRGVDDGTRKKSEALVTYLFKCENIATSQLLDQVKGICFIFPDTVDRSLQNIHAQYGSDIGSPCICFQGSVASYNCSITWTSANLLPDYANPSCCKRVPKDPETIAHRLGVLYQPTVDMVVTNCKNICHVLNRMNSDQRENKIVLLNPDQIEIMKNTYEYLRTYYDGNEGIIDGLKNMRCIIVENGRRLVYPNQIVVEFPSGLSEIPPYLYKVPSQFTSCVDLFEKLGATKTVTSTQYSSVLRNLYMESGDIGLDPIQITKAFKAVKGFFETMDKQAHMESKDIWPLYLPGVKQDPESNSKNLVFLRPSTDILYNDVPHFKERIKQSHDLVLVKLADVGVNVSNEDSIVKKLPESIRPRMLTSVVHETLIEKSQPLSCSSTAQDLRHILTSSEFCHGLIRLIKHADHESDIETASDILTTVSEKLSCIQVYSIPNLQTRLVCNDRTIPGSEEHVTCFEETEDGNQKAVNIYIEKEAELLKYASKVAETVDRITGHLLKTMLVHLPMMLFSKPCEIKDLLDGLKIREDNSVLKTEGTCLPTLGNFIHIADHHLLVDDFTALSPGEYVGYELDDPSLRGEEGTPTYIYAIIIEEVTEEGQLTSPEPSSRKYRINTGKDKQHIVADVADLYKFCHTNPNKVTVNETFGLGSTRDSQSWKENQDRANRPARPASLEEARSEIQKVLENAFTLNERIRQKIIKRLFLKWHPDKNPKKGEFCTEIFKFIQNEVERLEADININQPISGNEGGVKQDETLDSCFRRWGKRATCHKEERERNAFSDRDFDSPRRKNPQPAEARRWFKQAVADLNAAKSENEHKPSYEWVSFKCHQSAEKALKAAQYSLDADKTNVHDLRILAQDLDNEPLQDLASMLEHVTGNSTRMRYPDQVQYPDIPNNLYTDTIASDAINLAESIVKTVETDYMH